MEIKSKMLLPRTEAETPEETDPRLELVKQLIEYKKYKEAAALLDEQAQRQQARLAAHADRDSRSARVWRTSRCARWSCGTW